MHAVHIHTPRQSSYAHNNVNTSKKTILNGSLMEVKMALAFKVRKIFTHCHAKYYWVQFQGFSVPQ